MTEVEEVEKLYVSPDVCMWPEDETNSYHIEITLPGVEKDTIKLKMHEDSFFIKGETEDTVKEIGDPIKTRFDILDIKNKE